MDRKFRDATPPENAPQRSAIPGDDPFDDLLNDPYATYPADEHTPPDDHSALEAIARDGAGSASRLPASAREPMAPEISSSRWLPADEAENAWRTGTMRAITGKHRAVRPRTRPLPSPKRFRRAAPVRSGFLLVLTIALVIAGTIGAVDLGQQAYRTYQQSRPHVTVTPAPHHATPTLTATPHR